MRGRTGPERTNLEGSFSHPLPASAASLGARKRSSPAGVARGLPGSASTTASERVRRTVNVLLLICCLGVLSRGGLLAWQYYTLYRSERVARIFLERVWERQQAFRRATDRYAGTLDALNMRAPDDAEHRLIAFNRPGRQGFWAEHCSVLGCLSLDEAGQIRSAVSLTVKGSLTSSHQGSSAQGDSPMPQATASAEQESASGPEGSREPRAVVP